MADYESPNNNYKRPSSSFLNFIPKSWSDTESMMSPTSILDFKPLKNTPNQESGLSLGLIEALKNTPKSGSRTVVFGSQLKIEVPPPVFSPSEFGIKTGPFSAAEMELSEDYTCVISYGPNPKTTHIFDDCIVESCCGVVKFSESRKDHSFANPSITAYPSDNFLSSCCRCNKKLEQGCDIYMYR